MGHPRSVKTVPELRGHYIENGQHMAAVESMQSGLGCTPRVCRNEVWTTRESQPGSILKHAQKDCLRGCEATNGETVCGETSEN